MEFNNKLDVEYNLPITSSRNAKWCASLSGRFRLCSVSTAESHCATSSDCSQTASPALYGCALHAQAFNADRKATVMFNSQPKFKLNAGGTQLFTTSLLLWELESWVCPQLFRTWAGLVVWSSSSCHGLSLCTPCGSWSRCMRWMAAGTTSSTFILHTFCATPASSL